MNLVDYDYYADKQSDAVGLSRVRATLIKAARAEVTNSVLVDNGDLLQGTPLAIMWRKDVCCVLARLILPTRQ